MLEKKIIKKYKYKRDKYLYPSETFKNENSFKIIKTKDYIWSLEGDNQETLIGTLVKTQNLDVKIINLKPLQETNIFNFKKNTSYLSLSNNLEIFFDDKKKFLLSKKDGLYLPRNYSFKIKNLNKFEKKIIFCVGI